MSRSVKALLLSFLVYLLPILTAHGGSLLGIILWAELVDGGSGREALWLALDAGLGLALQLAAFIAFRWMLGGQRLRWLGLAVFVPVLFSAFNLAYQVEIPKRFLIEAETAVETGDWPVACSVADAAAAGLPAGVTLALERAGEVWIRTGSGRALRGAVDARLPGRAAAVVLSGRARRHWLRRAGRGDFL